MLEPVLGDGQRLALPDDVRARELDLILERADANIGGRHIAQQRDEHVIIARDRGEIGSIGGFDAAADTAAYPLPP